MAPGSPSAPIGFQLSRASGGPVGPYQEAPLHGLRAPVQARPDAYTIRNYGSLVNINPHSS